MRALADVRESIRIVQIGLRGEDWVCKYVTDFEGILAEPVFVRLNHAPEFSHIERRGFPVCTMAED
jgi:hypothetical protein